MENYQTHSDSNKYSKQSVDGILRKKKINILDIKNTDKTKSLKNIKKKIGKSNNTGNSNISKTKKGYKIKNKAGKVMLNEKVPKNDKGNIISSTSSIFRKKG